MILFPKRVLNGHFDDVHFPNLLINAGYSFVFEVVYWAVRINIVTSFKIDYEHVIIILLHVS